MALQRLGFFSKNARRGAIDGKRQVRLAFCLIHSRVCTGVNDQIRAMGANLCADLFGLAQIQLVTAQHNQLGHIAKLLLQLNGHLAGLAADKDF